MIDTVAYVWGGRPAPESKRVAARRAEETAAIAQLRDQLGTERLGRGPRAREVQRLEKKIGELEQLRGQRIRERQPVGGEPIRLDWDRLVDRLGSPAGEVREIHYERGTWRSGHWKAGDGAIDVMYRDGRLEARTSLPKLLVGRNDVVLNERGVHEALRALVEHLSEAIDHPLSLREATPIRLDYAIQWEVTSVAALQTQIKQMFRPPRKVVDEIISPRGGRTLWYGRAAKLSIRFYDKVGELIAAGGDPIVELDVDEFGPLLERTETAPRTLDRLLRYEVQDRRRGGELRLIHERGYRAADVRAELERPIAPLEAVWPRDIDRLIDEAGGNRSVSTVLAALYLAEHREAEAILRNRLHRNTMANWRRRARDAALATYAWRPEIPRQAFVADVGSIWEADDSMDAAA